MLRFKNIAKPALLAGAMGLTLASVAQAQEMRFEHVMNIGSTGTGEGQFKYVEDFDLTVDGRYLMATDAAHAWVQVFDKKTGKFISRFGGKGDEDESLEKPEGISTAPDGRIFVADYTTGYVKIYNKNYEWLDTFSEYGTEPGQNFKSEFTSIYDGKYYMPEVGNHRVNVFDLTGKFLFEFGGKGTAPGKMNNPEAAKANSRGHIYVSDLKNDRMQVFDKNGKFQFTWGETGSGPGQFKAPAGVGIDANDNVYVSEIGNNRVQVFDKRGNFITMFGSRGSGNSQFGNLHGLFVDKSTGWIYVADTANDRVQVFKPAGAPS